VTDVHWLSTTEVRLVHVRPSGEVITRFSTPENDTATNNSEPEGPPYVTERHSLSAAEVRFVHVRPSGEVITRLPVPV
jgi:hypothetical protein